MPGNCVITPMLVMGLVVSSVASSPALAQPVPGALVPTIITATPSPTPGTTLVERDTMIRLMVLNEVTTKTAHPADRFALVVDEDVVVDGIKIIPVGSKAWGEVISASESGGLG